MIPLIASAPAACSSSSSAASEVREAEADADPPPRAAPGTEARAGETHSRPCRRRGWCKAGVAAKLDGPVVSGPAATPYSGLRN